MTAIQRKPRTLMLIDETTFVVTDTETTGLQPGPHRVTEIGAVKIEGGRITDTFSRLVNPGTPIPRQIRRLTGITTQMVSAAPPASEILPEYLDFLGDGVFVGHIAVFDRKFLQFELREASIDFRIGSALCTRRMALRILHALPSKSLSSLMRHYGISAKRRHRALDDARATAEVLLRLLTALRNETGVESVEELLRFQHSRHEKHLTVPASIRRIRSDRLGTLPEVPGVYLFKDAGRQILYVGKARNIRSRVRSYFVGIDTHPVRIRRLVKL
ncbi:MAG: exonuclease domain-containing protein, partial [Rhodothermia bacterium]